MKIITVLGEGAWGTAIATLFAHNGYTVKLWCYDADVAKQIYATRMNERYLPGIILSPLIIPTTDLREALCGSLFVFEAIPIKFLRSVLTQAIRCFNSEQTWVVLSKGIEQNTLMLPTQIIDDSFSQSVKKMVLVGPSFATDLARKKITAVVVAAPNCDQGRILQGMLANEYFRPYITTDIVGAQVGAALKNVITLGIGMLDGAGYTDNAKAFLITRGLAEMADLAHALGGMKETMYGLAGVGDLVLTATSMTSKNLQVGHQIGRGILLTTIEKEIGTVPEGINTVQSAHALMRKYPSLSLPICQGIYDCIFSGKSVTKMMHELMNKPLTLECEL